MQIHCVGNVVLYNSAVEMLLVVDNCKLVTELHLSGCHSCCK